jgi:ABC-type glycerol-3-phosphate transport system permease component
MADQRTDAVQSRQVHSGRLRETRGDRLLRTFCYLISFIWCGFTVFPIYWMFTSTFKDAVDVNRMPPVFFPSLPSAYTVRLDYSDVAETMDAAALDHAIREDMALVVWRVTDMMPQIHLGKINAEAWNGDRKVAQVSLPYYQYKHYRGQLWAAQRLSDNLVRREIARAHFPTQLSIDLNGSLEPIALGKTDTEAVAKITKLFDGEIQPTGRFVVVGERTHLPSLINNYVDAWRAPSRRYPDLSVANYFLNGLTITGAAIIVHWLISGGAGYALSRLLSPSLSKYMTVFFLATMMVPSATTLVPLYELVGKMGLLDTFWGVILPGIPGAFAIYLYKGFFDALPQDILDAARIDGASEYRTFFRIAVPMSRNVFTVIALLTFLASWNDFFWPLLVLRSANRWTFTLAIYFSTTSMKQAAYLGSAMATAVIASLPTLIVFAIFSRSIQQGLVWSGLKG